MNYYLAKITKYYSDWAKLSHFNNGEIIYSLVKADNEEQAMEKLEKMYLKSINDLEILETIE